VSEKESDRGKGTEGGDGSVGLRVKLKICVYLILVCRWRKKKGEGGKEKRTVVHRPPEPVRGAGGHRRSVIATGQESRRGKESGGKEGVNKGGLTGPQGDRWVRYSRGTVEENG